MKGRDNRLLTWISHHLNVFTNGWVIVTVGAAVVTFLGFHAGLWRLNKAVSGILRQMPRTVVGSIKEVAELDAVFKVHPGLRSAWELYRESCTRHEWSGGLPSPVPFFSQQRLVDLSGQRRLAEAVPGILTALGILGTFIGLAAGLTSLDPEALQSAEGLSRSVGPLLGGMQLAFHTSIAGIFCSIAWSVADRCSYRYTLNRLAQLHDYLDALFPPVTEEALLHRFVRNQEEHEANLKTLISDTLIPQLTAGVKGALEDTLVPHLELTTEAMKEIGQLSVDRQDERLRQMVDHFIASLNNTLEGQLTELAEVLRETVSWQRSVKEELSDLVGDLREAVQVQQQSLEASRRLLGELDTLSAGFDERVQRISERMAGLEAILERLIQAEQQVQQSLEAARETEQRLTQMRDEMIAQTQQQVAELRTLWQEAGAGLTELSEDLQGVSEELRSGMRDGVNVFVEKLHDGLAQTFADYDQHLARAAERLGGVVGTLDEKMEDLTRLLQRLGAQTRETGEALQESVGELPAILQAIDQRLGAFSRGVDQLARELAVTRERGGGGGVAVPEGDR